MVRAGFGVRMKMPPPLIPPPGGPNPRFSSAIPNVPSARKPRDFFGEPPALPFIRRPPPPPLMGQKSMLPPSPLKPRFFAPRDATSDFPTRPLRMRMAPRMGFGVKTNFAGGSMPRPRLAKGAAPGSVPRPRLAKAAASGSMPRPRLAKVEPPGSELLRFPPVLKATKAGKIDSKGKKKGKKKKKTYTLTKEKSLKKPWVNETLKVEIEKKFTLLEEAKTKNEPSAWDAYLVQKKLVDDINHALRLEYLGNHSDAEYPYYCETCDRGFISLNLFSAHKSQHITCGKEGCSFTGHPKIVEKHYMMQHRTGLFNRIVKGNSPEEIEKWITERKKHFPTKQKIEEKQAQRVEMEKRGERYAERKKAFNQRNNNFKTGPNNRFDKNAGNKPSSHKFKTFGGRGTFARNKSATEGLEPQRKKREPIVAEEEDCVVRNLPPFRGTAYYLNLESIISDEDSVSVMSACSDNCSDFTNECEDDRSGENVIAEIEKDSSNFNENTEGDCLDKHFKNDIYDLDIGISCDDESKNIDHIVVPCKDVPSTCIEDDKVTHSVTRIAPSVDPPKVAEKTVTNVNNSLALLQCYDSEDNSDEDNVVDVQNYDKSDIPPQPALVDDDDSGPDECSSKPNKPFDEEDKLVNDNANSENVSNEKSTESKKRRRKRRRDSKSEEDDIKNTEKSITEDKTSKAFHPRKRYRPPTLLEKLLAQEIKHERNVILQCVRYVVENNYFNIGSSKENIS